MLIVFFSYKKCYEIMSFKTLFHSISGMSSLMVWFLKICKFHRISIDIDFTELFNNVHFSCYNKFI